jgi:hypothetical protein
MPTSLRRLLDRAAEKVNRSAAGTAVPAGLEPPRPGDRPKPTARERTLMRRRLRALRKRREAPAADAAHGAQGDSLATADGARRRDRDEIEAEIALLESALAERKTLDALLSSSTLGRCTSCGELVGRRERQCSGCGAQLPGHGHEGGQRAVPRAPHAAPVPTAASSGRSPTPPAR